MDFIVKLLISESFDTILTITDTFSKASIFIPCNETINAEQTTKLYTTYILPHYGLPTCIISNCDPCFTSVFSRELCCTLGIAQNISTAYHLLRLIGLHLLHRYIGLPLSPFSFLPHTEAHVRYGSRLSLCMI